MILRARIGSQATTKGTHHFRVTGVGFQAHLVTCDPIFFTSKRRNSEYGHKRPMSHAADALVTYGPSGSLSRSIELDPFPRRASSFLILQEVGLGH